MFLIFANNFKDNLIAFCKSLSIYLSVRPEMEAGAGVRVGAQEMAVVDLGVPLLLVRALSALRRMQGPAI